MLVPMRALLTALVLASMVTSTGACTHVAPWQRERLAHPGMSLAPEPDDEAEQHVMESREGSSGGYGSVGGGCGCN
jgi:hypothetical protein